MTCSSSKTDAPEDQGLRILARIIARDWARRHFSKAGAERRDEDLVTDEQSVTTAEAVPVA